MKEGTYSNLFLAKTFDRKAKEEKDVLLTESQVDRCLPALRVFDVTTCVVCVAVEEELRLRLVAFCARQASVLSK